MEGGLWEVPPCSPCVQGGCGGLLRLYGVPLVVSAMDDEDFGGRQLIHLGGLGVMAGDVELGVLVFAGLGVRDDVVGRPFVVGGNFCRVQFEWGISRAVLLWSRPGIVGCRPPGPQPLWLLLSQLRGGQWCWSPGEGGAGWGVRLSWS